MRRAVAVCVGGTRALGVSSVQARFLKTDEQLMGEVRDAIQSAGKSAQESPDKAADVLLRLATRHGLREHKESDEQLVRTYFAAAHGLLQLRRYDDALDLFGRSLAIREARAAAATPKTAEQPDDAEDPWGPTQLTKEYFVVGQIQLTKGDAAAALETYEKLFAIAEAQHTHESDDEKLYLAELYCRVAAHFQHKGEQEPALKYFSRALEIREPVAPDTEETAVLYFNLSQLKASVGGVMDGKQHSTNEEMKKAQAEAMELSYKALAIMSKVKPESLEVASLLNVLGVLYHIQALFPKALEFQQKALEIQLKNDAPPEDMANTHNYLSALYLQLDRVEESQEATRKMKELIQLAQEEHQKAQENAAKAKPE